MNKRLSFILVLSFITAIPALAQTRTVTNTNLEKFRQKRLAAEKDYRENYTKLGFPSPEELERQNKQSRIERSELSKRIEAENQQNTGDFQAQASVLRSEIASVEAQINYLRGELNRFPEQRRFFYSSSYFPLPNTTFPPYIQPGIVTNLPFLGGTRAAINSSNVRIGTSARVVNPNPITTRQNYAGGGLQAEITIGGGRGFYRGGRGFYGNYYGNYPYLVPYVLNNNSYEREEVASRVRLLEQERAGLLARFQVLQNEARRAGVKID